MTHNGAVTLWRYIEQSDAAVTALAAWVGDELARWQESLRTYQNADTPPIQWVTYNQGGADGAKLE